MLNETFLFLPGIQEKSEQRLWQAGITTWDHFLETRSVVGTSSERLLFLKQRVRQAQQLLDTEHGVHAMSRMLGSRNVWRMWEHIMDEPRFLDIETTEYRHQVTLVGVSDGDFYQGFVRDRNLDTQNLRRALAGATCIITFNGASFDLPIIDRVFPGALPDVPHLDLRHICSQAGLHGGLKKIEQHLQIRRADGLRDVDGSDAIMMWYRHLQGDEKALGELVDYNAADVLNLAPIAQMVIPALWRKQRYGEAMPFAPLDRPWRAWNNI